jgi:5-methylcytosine-specific restriction endonuclease McrA
MTMLEIWSDEKQKKKKSENEKSHCCRKKLKTQNEKKIKKDFGLVIDEVCSLDSII